jgi:hypothetical protein
MTQLYSSHHCCRHHTRESVCRRAASFKRACGKHRQVKALSPHRRSAIALHSPDRVTETGLRVSGCSSLNTSARARWHRRTHRLGTDKALPRHTGRPSSQGLHLQSSILEDLTSRSCFSANKRLISVTQLQHLLWVLRDCGLPAKFCPMLFIFHLRFDATRVPANP